MHVPINLLSLSNTHLNFFYTGDGALRIRIINNIGEFTIDSQGLAIVIFLRKINFLQRIHVTCLSFWSLSMRLWVIKIEKAWLRFIKVVSVNFSVQGRITMNNEERF